MLSISVSQVLYKRGGKSKFKESKSAQSRRRVATTPKLAIFLRKYKANREVIYLEMGKVLGLHDLVFTNTSFNPLDPSVVTHNFHVIEAKTGLKGVRFHDLRHTFASLMLLRGAKPKVKSKPWDTFQWPLQWTFIRIS